MFREEKKEKKKGAGLVYQGVHIKAFAVLYR